MEDLAVGRTSDEPVAGSETVTEAPVEQRTSVRSWGIDIGFGHTKVASSSGVKKFKTVFAKARFSTSNSLSIKNILEFDGEEYLVGDDAADIEDVARLHTVEDIITWAPIFVAAAVRHSPERQKLCVGLPVHYVKNDKPMVEQLKAALRHFKINSQTYKFDVFVLAQGIGAANHHRINAKEYVVADVGFNTLDLVYVANGQPIEAKMLQNKGINILVDHVISYIQHTHDSTISISRAQDILETGIYTRRGKQHKLHDVIDQMAADYTQRVIDAALLSTWPNRLKDDAEKVLFTGGGANFIKPDQLSSGVSEIAEIAKNPEYANAIGFYKFAQSKGDK